jgi:hypothetical protein
MSQGCPRVEPSLGYSAGAYESSIWELVHGTPIAAAGRAYFLGSVEFRPKSLTKCRQAGLSQGQSFAPHASKDPYFQE